MKKLSNTFKLLLWTLVFITMTVGTVQADDCNLTGFTTYTQGGWSSKPNSTPGGLLANNFTTVFPNGLTFGGNFTIKFTSAAAIQAYKTGGGTPAALDKNYVDPTSTSAGNFGSQMMAFSLNYYFSEAGKIGTNGKNKLSELVIVSGTFAGKTVAQLFTIANSALGGANTGYSISDINEAIDKINNNFDNGNQDLGFLTCPVVVPQKASLGDKVWNDVNKNGLQDAGETGVQGVTVKLYNCSNNLMAITASTNQTGNYLFENLTPGDYYVEFVLPQNYVFSLKDQGGNDNLDSDADVLTGKTTCTTLVSGENDLSWDAGIYYMKPNTDVDLSLEKTADKTTVKDGDQVTYTITVTNNGQNNATGVVVSDILPSGTKFQSYSSSQGAYDNATGKWTAGTIAAQQKATLTLVVKIDVTATSSKAVDLGIAQDFNLFVLEDLNQPSSDTQGRVAVGRDATLASYSVGDQLNNSNGTVDVLIVGRDLTFKSGTVFGGNVVYGNSANIYPGVEAVNGTIRKGNVIDFAAAKVELEDLSKKLFEKNSNGTLTFEYGLINLVGTDPFLNVFTVKGSDLTSSNDFRISAPNGSVVLINIQGDNISWQGGLVVNGTSNNNVIFNFYETRQIKIEGIDVRGSILAPKAAVNFVSGVQNGQMIAKSVTGTGQFNFAMFLGNIPANIEILNTAEIAACDQDDPDSTPNNSNKNEDDYSSVLLTSDQNTSGSNNGDHSNNNTQWKKVGGFGENEIVWTLAIGPNNSLYSGTWGGKIYKSLDEGQKWQLINEGMNAAYIWSIKAGNDGTIFAATERGIFKLNSPDAKWAPAGLAGKDIRALAISGNTIYAGTWGEGVFKSNDLGINWTELNAGLDCKAVHALEIVNSDLYAGTFGAGVLKIGLNGNSWQKLNTGYDYIWSLAATKDGKIWAGTYGNGLLMSKDNGMSWTAMNNGLQALHIYSISLDKDDNIYVNGWNNGIYTSSDNGKNWGSMGMDGLGVSSMVVSPLSSNIIVGTADGTIFMCAKSVTSVEKTNANMPMEFSLSQNYPNPFNPSTSIEFSIAKDGYYSVKIYNILGQEIARLIEGSLKSGNYKLNFDAGKMASGVYLYRLQGGDVNITKKMILQK